MHDGSSGGKSNNSSGGGKSGGGNSGGGKSTGSNNAGGSDTINPIHNDIADDQWFQFKTIFESSNTLNAGRLEEAVVSLERVSLIFRTVGDEMMLVLALRPDGNLGKARYLMRRNLVALRDEL